MGDRVSRLNGREQRRCEDSVRPQWVARSQTHVIECGRQRERCGGRGAERQQQEPGHPWGGGGFHESYSCGCPPPFSCMNSTSWRLRDTTSRHPGYEHPRPRCPVPVGWSFVAERAIWKGDVVPVLRAWPADHGRRGVHAGRRKSVGRDAERVDADQRVGLLHKPATSRWHVAWVPHCIGASLLMSPR